MKTNKFLILLSLFTALLIISSCVKDDDFEIPNIIVTDPGLTANSTFANLVSRYNQAIQDGDQLTEISLDESELIIEGYVVSSDRAGNFFEELIIQNKVDDNTSNEDPRLGFKIEINVRNLSDAYEIGRKVYIKLNGLSIGLSHGVLTIGKANGNEITQLEEAEYRNFIIRDPEVANITPKTVTLSEITSADLNTLIQLPAAQFTESQLNQSFSGEVADEFDGERLIESCSADGGSITFLTSTFADFKSLQLPALAGTLTAVLSKDFFGDANVLLVRDTDDIVFNADRCSPTLLNPGITATTTFQAIKARFENSNGYEEFDLNENELIIEGYVVSSDEKGNFFEELYIQNTPLDTDLGQNNPRLGFRVSINSRDLYQTYAVGRKIYLKLNGLAIGLDDGVLTIGAQNVSEVAQIEDGLVPHFLTAGEVIEDITPLVKTVSELTPNDLSTLISIETLQFNRFQLGLTYSGEVTDSFDGVRGLESCNDNGIINLFTSTFADFKSITLPESSGTVTAVYTRNFSGDENILVVRDTNDLNMSGDRCDPPVLCDTPSGGGSVFYQEDFENFSNFVDEDWTSVNVNNGNVNWLVGSFSGNSYAQISGFSSNEDPIDVWLVTPTINMDNTEGEELKFEVQSNFDNGQILSLHYSNNFTGDVTTATWTEIEEVVIPIGPSNGFGTFELVGPINISCLDGDINFAFFYQGADPGATTRYHIDNIEITGN